MARIALITPEHAGHIYPVIAFAGELIRRGHEVTVLTRKAGVPLAEAAGIPVRVVPDDRSPPAPGYHLRWLAAQTVGAGWAVALLRSWIRWANIMLTEVPDILRELKTELLIADSTLTAARSAAERVGIPFVTLNSAMLWNMEPTIPTHTDGRPYSESAAAILQNRISNLVWQVYLRPVLRTINHYRANWNLPTHDHPHDIISPFAQITQLLQELDYPRRELTNACHYVGSLAVSRSGTPNDFPWEKLDGRKLIFASVGTDPSGANVRAFRGIAQACAEVDAQLVLTLGKSTEKFGNSRDKLGKLAGDPLVMDYVPQVELLKRTDLLITHAGANTVMEAIREAVPMVALPRGVDQPAMAARVEYRGLGLRDSFHHPRPAILRQKIERVLTEPSFKQRCLQMQQAAVKAGGVVRAGDIVERVLATGKPVTRDDMQRLTAEATPEAAAAEK